VHVRGRAIHERRRPGRDLSEGAICGCVDDNALRIRSRLAISRFVLADRAKTPSTELLATARKRKLDLIKARWRAKGEGFNRDEHR